MSNIHTPTDNVLTKSVAHNATATGSTASFDSLGFTRAKIILIATTGAGASVAAQLQDSPDNATFTNVAGGAFSAVGASQTGSVETMSVNLSARQRYLDVALTIAGTASVDVVVELYNPENYPVSQLAPPVVI